MDTGALIGKPERLESKKPDGSTETYDVKTLTECLERLCFVTKRKLTDISFAIYVTVVQNTEAYLQKFLNSFLTSDKFIEVGYGNVPLRTLVPHPGADRIVTAIAAEKKHGSDNEPLLVIDFGTATTLDVVERENDVIFITGGTIAIGPITMKAGFDRAVPALANKYELKKTERVVSRNVFEQTSAGAYYGYLGLVCRLIDDTVKELVADRRLVSPDSLNLVLTGGPSVIFQEDIEAEYSNNDLVSFKASDYELMMEGLFIIYKYNMLLREHEAKRQVKKKELSKL